MSDYPNDVPKDWAIEPSERTVVIDGAEVVVITGGLSKERVRAALDAEDKREAPGSGMMGILVGVALGICLTLAGVMIHAHWTVG